jgi:hypothetical protein
MLPPRHHSGENCPRTPNSSILLVDDHCTLSALLFRPNPTSFFRQSLPSPALLIDRRRCSLSLESRARTNNFLRIMKDLRNTMVDFRQHGQRLLDRVDLLRRKLPHVPLNIPPLNIPRIRPTRLILYIVGCLSFIFWLSYSLGVCCSEHSGIPINS